VGYKQRGDSWRVNVAYKGERLFATVATEALAKEKEVELKADLIRRARAAHPTETPVRLDEAPAVPKSWTLGVAADKAFEVHWTGTKSEKWWKQKVAVIEAHFKRETLLSAIDTDAVDAFKKALKDKGSNAKAKGNSQATINHHLAALSMIFKVAHQRGGAAVKPVMGIKGSSRERTRWLTDKEEEIIIRLLTQWGRPDILDWTILLVDTGLRPDESRRLTGTEVDFRTGTILNQYGKTKNARRTIPMTSRVKAMLERRCLEHPKGPLFPYGWHVYNHQWERLREAMHLEGDRDFVAYCLRHTFATRLVQRGVNIEVISKLLGHANINQTMVYAKLGAHQYVAAIAKLEPQGTL
jgi:integrase